MNVFALSSTFFAAVCLAAKGTGKSDSPCDASTGEVDSLRTMIMKQHQNLLPSVLVSLNCWEEDEEDAFTLGLALGNHCDKKNSSNSSNTDGSGNQMEHEYGLLTSGNGETEVYMSTLDSIIAASMKTSDSFAKFFNIELLESNEFKSNSLQFKNVRRLFAEHAKSATSMLAIDVAILRWLVHAIRTKPEHITFLWVDREIVMAVCSLTMYSRVPEHCVNDILLVFSQVQHFTSMDYYNHYTATLITLLKFLEEGLIRTKIEELLTDSSCCKGFDFTTSMMLLGDEHPFLEVLKKSVSEADFVAPNNDFKRKLHSMSNDLIKSLKPRELFIELSFCSRHSAIISTDDSLVWIDEINVNHKKSTVFRNSQGRQQGNENRLFIFSNSHAPAFFWDVITSCRSMSKFLEIMEHPLIHRMILTYGITILESNSAFELVNVRRL